MPSQCFRSVFVLVSVLSFLSILSAYDYEVLRFEDETQDDKIWKVSKFRVKKIEPGIYGVSGQFELLQTLGKKSKILVKFFYNTNGVGMWTLLPGQIGPEFGCDFLNDGYKRYLPGLPEASNFPKVGDDYYCPLQKGLYKMDTYSVNTTRVTSFVKPGFYKIQVTMDSDSGDTSVMNVYSKVARK